MIYHHQYMICYQDNLNSDGGRSDPSGTLIRILIDAYLYYHDRVMLKLKRTYIEGRDSRREEREKDKENQFCSVLVSLSIVSHP